MTRLQILRAKMSEHCFSLCPSHERSTEGHFRQFLCQQKPQCILDAFQLVQEFIASDSNAPVR